MTAPEIMTVAEVADFLRLKPKGVYLLVERRAIPFVRLSNRLRFFRTDLLAWLRASGVEAERK